MYLSRLTLSHYRNHSFLDMPLSPQPTILVGANGSGKTNILEAISYMTPGRGLRGALLRELIQKEQNQPLGISLELNQDLRLTSTYNGEKRINKIQGEVSKSTTEFLEWFYVGWLTPDHDRLLTEPAKVRRRFLDRMIYAYDPLHAERIQNYEQTLKERLKVLQNGANGLWLTSLEHQMAEFAVAIAYARQEMLLRLEKSVQELLSDFPSFTCYQKGDIEENLHLKKAVEWEEWLKEQWAFSRIRDKEAHMTTIGVHRSDWGVIHTTKGEGSLCSTGEQKMLVFGIIFSFLWHKLQWDEKLVVMILDECVSHLDSFHRQIVFEQINTLHSHQNFNSHFQAFLSGTDAHLFDAFKNKSNFYKISPCEATLI